MYLALAARARALAEGAGRRSRTRSGQEGWASLDSSSWSFRYSKQYLRHFQEESRWTRQEFKKQKRESNLSRKQGPSDDFWRQERRNYHSGQNNKLVIEPFKTLGTQKEKRDQKKRKSGGKKPTV